VISDVQMPGMSGPELCRAILQSSIIILKPIVVAFTADTSEAVARECLQSGMRNVLHKPLTTGQLLEFFNSLGVSMELS